MKPTVKGDMRKMRTEKALINAMLSLLETRSFVRLTVQDLCREAWISRATFYAHFNDKYDLLRYWLNHLETELKPRDDSYHQLEQSINRFVHRRKNIIKNLMENASPETLALLHHCILSKIFYSGEMQKPEPDTSDVVLSSFLVGGILYYISWQINNKFPRKLQLLNPYLYEMIRLLKKWEPDHSMAKGERRPVRG